MLFNILFNGSSDLKGVAVSFTGHEKLDMKMGVYINYFSVCGPLLAGAEFLSSWYCSKHV